MKMMTTAMTARKRQRRQDVPRRRRRQWSNIRYICCKCQTNMINKCWQKLLSIKLLPHSMQAQNTCLSSKEKHRERWDVHWILVAGQMQVEQELVQAYDDAACSFHLDCECSAAALLLQAKWVWTAQCWISILVMTWIIQQKLMKVDKLVSWERGLLRWAWLLNCPSDCKCWGIYKLSPMSDLTRGQKVI